MRERLRVRSQILPVSGGKKQNVYPLYRSFKEGKVCYQQKKRVSQLSNNNIYSLLYFFKLTDTHLSFWESCDVHQSSPICISTIRLSSSLAFSCSSFTVSHALIFPDLSPIRRVSCLSPDTRRAVMGHECTRSGKM